MPESHVAAVHFIEVQRPALELILSPMTFSAEREPSHPCSDSISGESPLRRIDSGYFEGPCQLEENAESLACVEDIRSCRPESPIPEPHLDNCIKLQQPQHPTRQDFWKPDPSLHWTDHGYLHPDICTHTQMAAICSHAVGSCENMEVVRYTRVLPESGVQGPPSFKTSQLFGPYAPGVEAGFRQWAAERARLHRRQARMNIRNLKEKQRQANGGLLASLRRRIDRPTGCPAILHCRVNKPARPEKTLLSDYTNAFRAWDVAMSKSIPGYADNYEKRHWYISQWDTPSPQ
ncbi:hypothetical protein AYL99_06536 [Fonsecaea erecta]|uniref:Uncharacterized protein n=1 Tax=Fonsecaea erecta TaxID=1367422 RepID=A0A178ZHI2_9EURO|nr:hypothetical protein AYL99_06536 [Fonsecaea erecta]OAP59238.1 hypothetical protein AYL99_06536 [Fonsecaea erecta]